MTGVRIGLRPVTPGDKAFLRRVYGSTREEELAPLGWSAEQQEAFIRHQFEAQDTHYRRYYPSAQFLVIMVDERPAGRLYVARGVEEIRLIDITLLPEFRGAGVGSQLLGELIEEARATDRPLRIHVEKFNPALRLYERLGFTPIEDRGVYWFLEWSPARERERDGAGMVETRNDGNV